MGRAELGACVVLASLVACGPSTGAPEDAGLDADRAEAGLDRDAAPPPVPPAPGSDGARLDALRHASAVAPSGHAEGGIVTTLVLDAPLPGDAGTDIVDRMLRFLEENRALYRLDDPRAELRLAEVPVDGALPTWTWKQHRQGIEILGASLAMVVVGDRVRMTHGRWMPEQSSEALDLSPRISGARALEAVLQPGERPAGLPRLCLVDGRLVPGLSRGLRLAWEVAVAGEHARGSLVDARTGAVLIEFPDAHSEYPFRHHQVRGLALAPQTARDQGTLWFDESGAQPAYTAAGDADLEGARGHQHARDLDDWYYDGLGRRGYSGLGGDEWDFQFQLHVDLAFVNEDGTPAPNAYGSAKAGLMQFQQGWAVTDVVGHEYAHLWEGWESQLFYAGESGALAESVADVFGVLYGRAHGDLDWQLGEEIPGFSGRDLADPPNRGQPDHVLAALSGDGLGLRPVPLTVNAGNDFGSVHTNSGIPNKAAYLSAFGGMHRGVQVRGLGEDALRTLLYIAVSGVIGRSETLTTFGFGVVGVAHVLETVDPGDYGFAYTPLDASACNVEKAYWSVGMWFGVLDSDCDGTRDDAEWDNDADLAPDGADNCPRTSNPAQADGDGDGLGDACDPDKDGDGIRNQDDLCPGRADPGQEDGDGDGEGDACDDRDGDTVVDALDDCVDVADSMQSDVDGDGEGDECDDDDDGDGRPDARDVCPAQAVGDHGDPDRDGVGNVCDNCPDVGNVDQGDCNHDDVGNACDRSFSVCEGELARLSRGVLSPRSVLPLPSGCAGCPATLGTDWMGRVALALGIAAPAGVGVDVVRADGTIVAHTVGAGNVTVSVGPGYEYRPPGAALHGHFEPLGLRLDARATAPVTIGVVGR